MKPNHLFYDSSVNFKNITKKKIFGAILIGITSAITIYCFTYIVREVFRIISLSFQLLPDLISESDRFYYNLFFAALALIFGNSIAINYLLSRPQNIFSRRNNKRNRILNDQIFLNFNFVYWFFKISTMIGIFSMSFMDFQYFPNFIFPTALLIMILYLESWKTLNLVLGLKNLKWMFLHFSAFILLSFGLANIDIVDYKAFDELKLKNNPTYSLPKSKYSDKNDYRYRDVSLKLSLSDDKKLKIFTEDKRHITLSEVANEIINYRSTIREEQIPFLGVRIYANKELDLIYIKELEAELYLINQQRIIYEIYNEDAYSRKFEHKGISRLISNDILKFRNTEYSVSKDNLTLPPMAPFSFKEQKIEDTLNVFVAEEIFLENISVSKYELTDELKKHVNPCTLIQYNYFEKTKYQDYINVLSSHFQAVNDLRQDASSGFDISKQTYLYSKEERIELNQLKIKYPIIIQEILIKTPYPKTP